MKLFIILLSLVSITIACRSDSECPSGQCFFRQCFNNDLFNSQYTPINRYECTKHFHCSPSKWCVRNSCRARPSKPRFYRKNAANDGSEYICLLNPLHCDIAK